MNKRMARTTELYKNPDLIIPQNTVAHYNANTTPQDEIYFLDFSRAILAPEEAFRLYDRAMTLLTLALDIFRLIGVKEEEMLELVK